MDYRYFVPFLFLMVLIAYLSTVPYLGSFIPGDVLNQVIRKSGHVLMFSILTLLLWRSLPPGSHRWGSRVALVLLLLLSFSAITEACQIYVPSRRGNIVGFSFNVLGIFATMIYLTLSNLKDNHTSS